MLPNIVMFASLSIFEGCRLTMFSVLAPVEGEEESGNVDTSAGRFVRYQFTPAFLKLRTVGAT